MFEYIKKWILVCSLYFRHFIRNINKTLNQLQIEPFFWNSVGLLLLGCSVWFWSRVCMIEQPLFLLWLQRCIKVNTALSWLRLGVSHESIFDIAQTSYRISNMPEIVVLLTISEGFSCSFPANISEALTINQINVNVLCLNVFSTLH